MLVLERSARVTRGAVRVVLDIVTTYAVPAGIVAPALVAVTKKWLDNRLAWRIYRRSGAKDAAIVLRALRNQPRDERVSDSTPATSTRDAGDSNGV